MNKEAMVLIPRDLLEGTKAILWCTGCEAIVKELEQAIDAAPEACIPISKAHNCYNCYAEYDGRCRPNDRSLGLIYPYRDGSGAPGWCPQICKEVKDV